MPSAYNFPGFADRKLAAALHTSKHLACNLSDYHQKAEPEDRALSSIAHCHVSIFVFSSKLIFAFLKSRSQIIAT